MDNSKCMNFTELLPKPLPSPDPNIFENEEIKLSFNNNIFKIKINREYSDLLYDSISYNSDLMLWNIKNVNISSHHLFFLLKIYSSSCDYLCLLNNVKTLLYK